MNVEEQKAKLLKDLDTIKKDFKRSDAKLKNKKFMDSAPEDVVQREKRILLESKRNISNIESILDQLW